MNRRATRRIIIGVIGFVAVMILTQLIFYANVYLEKKANHDKIVKIVNEDLVFRWDTLDSELDYLNNLIGTGHYFNEDIGRLYERAGLIYMQKGETMTYYRYLGYALYYLERSNDKDYTVNIYLDLANFFMNNCTGDAAKNMMEDAREVEPFEEIEDIQIKSYAYRMLGIMAIFEEDYSSAEENLKISQSLVDSSNTNVYEEVYTAINDVWLARVYVDTGRYEECHKKLDKWEGHDMFTTDVYRQIMLRDFIVPYYQTKVFLFSAEIIEGAEDLNDGKREERELQIAEVLKQFMDLCDENGYEKTELSTILKLQSDYPPTSEAVRTELFSIVNNLYTVLFDNQNKIYANVIDSTVIDSKSEMAKNELLRKQYVRRMEIILFSVLVVVIVIIIFITILLNNRYDALSGLFNRRSFNHALARAKRRKKDYGIIMIDIDDFKQINDNYGHQNGDIVIYRLGQIMQREITPDVHCFRYGGEEFVILLDKRALPYAKSVAERLRTLMEHQTWEFGDKFVVTISVGVAIGSGNTDVLKNADDCLYQSKEKGKNRLTVFGG